MRPTHERRMSRWFWISCLLTAALAWGVALPAQAPADVVRELFAAVDSADWSRVVALSHPDALKRFHAQQVSEARLDDDTRADPSLPAEFREHKPVYVLLYKVQTADQLAAMPAPVMLSHFLRMTHRAPRRTAAASDTLTEVHEARRIVGTLMDGDSIAYVVFIKTIPSQAAADTLPGFDPDMPEAMTLKRDGGVWKTMLDGGLVWGTGGWAIFASDDDH